MSDKTPRALLDRARHSISLATHREGDASLASAITAIDQLADIIEQLLPPDDAPLGSKAGASFVPLDAELAIRAAERERLARLLETDSSIAAFCDPRIVEFIRKAKP